MIIIKLRINNKFNSTFYSRELLESSAILNLLRILKAIFKQPTLKIIKYGKNIESNI